MSQRNPFFASADPVAWHPSYWEARQLRLLLATRENGLLTSPWAQFNIFGNPMDGSYGNMPLMPAGFGNLLRTVAQYVLDEVLVPARQVAGHLSVGMIAEFYFDNGAKISTITGLLNCFEHDIGAAINHEQMRISRTQFNFLVLLAMIEAAREAGDPILSIDHDGAIRRDDGSIDLSIVVKLIY